MFKVVILLHNFSFIEKSKSHTIITISKKHLQNTL